MTTSIDLSKSDMHALHSKYLKLLTVLNVDTFMSNLNGHTVCLGHYGT